MNKKLFALALAVLMLTAVFSGCGKEASQISVEETTAQTAPTVPANGNPRDVTCLGSYTAQDDTASDTVVASVKDQQLTNEQLQVWYAMAVAAYQQEVRQDAAPDFSQPLDTQPCPIDDSVNSWQQYFLKQALTAWHSAQALAQQAADVEFTAEEAYQPIERNHEIYMTGMPATEYLYGYHMLYEPNSMHQAYLDALPETLEELAKDMGYADLGDMAASAAGVSEETLTEAVHLYNYAYMYFTQLSYDIAPSEEEITAYLTAHQSAYPDSGKTVDFRHILLVPEGSEESCLEEAEDLLKSWQKLYKRTEGAFADLAYKNSDDTGTARDGGAYFGIRQGQLPAELDSWCFDEARQPGDTAILRSDFGIHVVYFSRSTDIAYDQAETDLTTEMQAQLVTAARDSYPAKVDYSLIALEQAEPSVSFTDVLYPDIAHERFPEIPLYLQQDYGLTMYGGHKLSTNGCGITSMAMLASYMTDDALTPPEMCERYGNYSHHNGTDGMIFIYEPPVMGFYLREKTYEPPVAKAALEEGQVVISVQHAGYWTRGGHYIVLEKMNEDGTIQVRDSNIFNYGRIVSHAQDSHTWGSITTSGSGYWIFEDKITTIPACSRCGEEDSIVSGLLEGDFNCRKCAPALLRRNTYLSACGA